MATIRNISGSTMGIDASWMEGVEARYVGLNLANNATGTIPDEALNTPAISEALTDGDLVIVAHGTDLGDIIPRVAVSHGTFTATAGTATTVADTAVTATSTIIVCAWDARAGALVGNAASVYVGSDDVTANTSFRVHHTSGATGLENFWYVILG